jgi:hypothetical protein
MLNEEQLQFEEEERMGLQARSAYDNYVKTFLNKQKEYCYSQFRETHCNSISDLQTIKYLLDSITTLENAILSDMITGKLATKQLDNR